MIKQGLLRLQAETKEQTKANGQIIAVVATALRVFSERAVNASFPLLGLAGAFLLFRSIIQEPNVTQLGALSIFVAFVLGLTYVRK